MTIFLSHVAADQEAAQSLESALERRGQFVERDDGRAALRPVQPSDVVVLLVSKDFVFSPARLRLEQRALDAWADQRLIIVKLDHAIAPVGLRDQPSIDASFEAQREFTWLKVADAVRATLTASPAALKSEKAPDQKVPWDDELKELDQEGRQDVQRRQDAESVQRKARGDSRTSLIIGVLLMLPGLAALAVTGAIFLVNRIGPTPAALADLVRGVEEFGATRGVPAGVTPIVFAVAIVVTLLSPLVIILLASMRRAHLDAYAREHPEIYEDYESPPGAPKTDAVFVSYARANSPVVMAVIEAATTAGRRFWIDQQGIVTGDSWAGEIVRAIKNAAGVVIMCSKAAFESDHVKREIYLADRYHKKLVPVFIEDAEPPEDFEYFFAGVQALKLFETPEPERSAALVRALGEAPA